MTRSAVDDPRIVRLSPPDSVMGLLQRGRGEGFLAAKSMAGDEARDLVWRCVVHDPRWDLQVESRTAYYALLIEELAIDIDRFSAGNCPLPFEDVDQRPVVNVLGELATRGHDVAGQVLLSHVAEGEQWDDAIYQLSVIPQSNYLNQLVQVLETRFNEDDREAIVARWSNEIPWGELGSGRMWVQRGLATSQHWAQSRGPAPEFPDMDEGAGVLLAFPWPPVLPKRLVHRLTNMLRKGELELMVEAVNAPGTAQWVAFNALGRLNHPGGIDVAAAILEADESGPSRRGAFRYFNLLESGHTLPLARLWYSLDDGRVVAAEQIFARHAEPSDVPLLVDQLRKAWARRDFYSLCSYAEALKLHPTGVPWGLCAEIFEQSEYSYSRGIVAETLVAANRGMFIERYGTAAAYDCEPQVRDLVDGGAF